MPITSTPSLLLEPEQLRELLNEPQLLIVDLSDPARYQAGHIPGAVHLTYARLLRGTLPAKGLVPDAATLSTVFDQIGLTPTRYVVAYDAEGNGRASRLLWTLALIGHTRVSLLNGGIHAWVTAGGLLQTAEPVLHPPYFMTGQATTVHEQHAPYAVQFAEPAAALADRAFILGRLGKRDTVFLDVRTIAEYMGMDQRAARAGHIPSAVHFNWADMLDPTRQLRLQPAPVLRQVLDQRGVTTDKEVIVYSHAHRRSAHTYWVLRYLNYPRVRAYPGGWSEWGNDPSVPIEA